MGDSKIHSSFLLFIRILAEVSFVFMAAALPTNNHYSTLASPIAQSYFTEGDLTRPPPPSRATEPIFDSVCIRVN